MSRATRGCALPLEVPFSFFRNQEEHEARRETFLCARACWQVDNDDEQQVLEQLMAEAQRVRAAAASEGISDHERRERAAELALRMLSLFGGDEGSDGDSDE